METIPGISRVVNNTVVLKGIANTNVRKLLKIKVTSEYAKRKQFSYLKDTKHSLKDNCKRKVFP